MSLFAFGLIVTAAIGGRLTAHAPQLLRFGALGATLIVATVFVTRQALAITIDPPASRAEVVQSMQLSRSDPPSVVHAVAPPADPPGIAALLALERIRARGALRMGFMGGRLPLGFTNLAGEPVGFEIEMGVQLARDLDVQLELVAMDLDQVGPYLEAGIVDLVPGIAHTHHWVRRVRLSTPYMDGTFALMVPDVRRREFDTIERLRRHDHLRIGILTVPDLRDDYAREIAGPVPYELVRVPADPDSLLGVDRPDVDVILVVAEIGTAWTLLYPDWSVVVPRPVVVRRPLGFALAPSAADLAAFVDSWLVLQEARSNIERGYEYRVLGLGARQERKRWSIGGMCFTGSTEAEEYQRTNRYHVRGSLCARHPFW